MTSKTRLFAQPVSLFGRCVLGVIVLALLSSAYASTDPWADNVVSYSQGTNPAAGLTDPTSALSQPTRDTNLTSPTGGAVTPFQPAFGADEIVSIGAGGHLTVSFDEPVVDDADNPFGIDLLVFGNAFYIYNAGSQSAAGGAFTEGGVIEVSANGTDFFTVSNTAADGLFPTNGYTDPSRDLTSLGPGGGVAVGTTPTDFTRPVDPARSVGAGDTLDDILAIYDGSGGGVGIDLAVVGLSEVSFVRISNPLGSSATPEIDGFADVAPGSFVLGDLNGDGSLDNLDIPEFVLALIDRAVYNTSNPGLDPDILGDFDGDGALNNLDIFGFVNALIGDDMLSVEQVILFEEAGLSIAGVPEPTSFALLCLAGLLVTQRCFRRSNDLGCIG
ncbi:MAG: hypothetical protein AAF711_01610 [Planctomycetota bacterium]